MTTAEDQGEVEKVRAEKLAAEVPPFDGVRSISVELGDDHSGDPAMWLVFHLQQNLVTDRAWIKQFNQYARTIQFKIIDSGLSRFPYTRFGKAA